MRIIIDAIVSRNSKLIDNSRSSEIAYGLLSSKIDSHLGHMFEVICAEWLETHCTVAEIGSWWGKDSEGEDVDIDIVAKISDDRGCINTLACECKFSKNPVGFIVLNTLIKRCEGANIRENVKYALFSAGGFQDELSEYAEENGIILVDAEMMLGIRPIPKFV